MTRSTVRRVSWSLIILANVLLCIIIVRSPNHPIYDEGYYWNVGIALFERHGLSLAFIKEWPAAAGPTYAIVPALARTLGLDFPWTRFVSYMFLVASAFVLGGTFRFAMRDRCREVSEVDPRILAGAFTILPTVAVSAGMALTETPALFFMSIALLVLARWDPSKEHTNVEYFVAIGCGIATSAAILGRINYIVVLPCVPLLMHWRLIGWRADLADEHELRYIGLAMVTTVMLLAPVFLMWGGFTPARIRAEMPAGLSLWHGVLSMGYAGIITLLLAPDVFRILIAQKIYLILILILAIGLCLATGLSAAPMQSVISALGGEKAIFVIRIGFTVLISALGLSFLLCMGNHLWQHRMEPFIRFCTCVTLLGLLSNMRITHQFSSRYVFVFMPFLVLSVASSVRANWHFPMRLAVGALLSIISLASYVWAAD